MQGPFFNPSMTAKSTSTNWHHGIGDSDNICGIENDFTKHVMEIVGGVLSHISLLNIFLAMLLPARCHQKCQAAFDNLEHECIKKYIVQIPGLFGLLNASMCKSIILHNHLFPYIPLR